MASPDIELCRREIQAVEAELLAGNPDVAGLCLALSDWWMELRILQGSTKRNAPTALSSWERADAYEHGLGEQYSLHSSDPHMAWDDSGTKALVAHNSSLLVTWNCRVPLR
jgi:hypothetical protein